MNKALLFTILLFFTIFLAHSEKLPLEKNWPEDLSYHIVNSYTEQNDTSNMEELKSKYVFLLDFLESAKNAHEKNIHNYIYNENLNRWEITYENGRFLIEEKSTVIYYWDTESEEHKTKADISVIEEFVNIISVLCTYNALIDFWYEKTGEILREKYNIENEKEDLIKYLAENNIGSIKPDVQREVYKKKK